MAQTTGVDLPVFVFDGDCAFCSSCARFIQRYLARGAAVVPWQRTDLAALGVTAQQAEASVVWVDGVGAPSFGPVAVARLLKHTRWWWYPLGALLDTRPAGWITWPVYRWVARNRHRMPGGTAACALPAADRVRGIGRE